ncbi:MAG TPA: hypothetical protein VJC03_01540 [bacterium]|nr:hypothetical protein [bacterium]
MSGKERVLSVKLEKPETASGRRTFRAKLLLDISRDSSSGILGLLLRRLKKR